MKVGLFIDTFYPMIDGVIGVVNNYAAGLQKYCDVVVIAPKGRTSFDDSALSYEVKRCKTNLKIFFLDYDLPLPALDESLWEYLKNEKLDIVHIHSPFAIGKLGIRYAKKHGVPVVATMHSQFRQDFYRSTHLKGVTALMLDTVMHQFNRCDECWAVNDEVARIFYYDYHAKKMPLVRYNGTDMKPLEDDFAARELKARWNVKRDEKVLLFIGRLTVLKNILFIADSLKILKDSGMKFKMIFVGTGTDEEKLKDRVREHGLDDHVIFTEKVADREEIAVYYQAADLFLFPSLYDCSSLVQIEAASQGTPTLFLRGAATAGTGTDGVNCYLSDNSEAAFADKIREIFSDEEKYRTIAANARRDLYVPWDAAIEKAYHDYERIIETKKTAKKEKFALFTK